MRKVILIFLIIVSSISISVGQKSSSTKLTSKDSIELTQVWKKYKQALENKDYYTLHHFSLKVVRCDIFQHPDVNRDYNPFISIDTFLSQFFHEQPRLKLWTVMRTKKFSIRVEQPYRFPQPNIKVKQKNPPIIYEIWYNTIMPNELGDGNEGMQNQFEFIKIDGEFKFFGLSSIP